VHTVDTVVSRDACPFAGAEDRPTAYAEYGAIETLLSLQHPRTGEPAERSFLVATQVMELLFDLLRRHWEQARDALEADAVPAALAALRRGAAVQDVLVASWDLVGSLTPAEFGRFRAALGDASGVQSAGYRHLEFLLGERAPGFLTAFRGMPEVRADLRRTLTSPGLHDAALRLLHRRGLPVPAERVDRDWARPCPPHPGVERVWAMVTADPRPGDEAADLAEALLDTAERHTRWRRRHAAAVKRSMGRAPGTAGTSGLDWLERTAARDVFPELWASRTLV
jgi:tryptophan 2,3-dioxygenase